MTTTTEYQIKDKDGVIIGRFQDKNDRDKALRVFCQYGFPHEEEMGY